METIIDILTDLKPGIDYAPETGLVRRRILDSLTIIALVSELEDEFDIEIPEDRLLAISSVGDALDAIEAAQEA